MNETALNILADAISDAGAWQWWHMEKDMLQLEFCGVQRGGIASSGTNSQLPISVCYGLESSSFSRN